MRRMRSGSVRIFNGNQWETFSLITQERIGATEQGQEVKNQGHKVMWRISRQKRYNSAVDGNINFKLGGNYQRSGRRVWYTF